MLLENEDAVVGPARQEPAPLPPITIEVATPVWGRLKYERIGPVMIETDAGPVTLARWRGRCVACGEAFEFVKRPATVAADPRIFKARTCPQHRMTDAVSGRIGRATQGAGAEERIADVRRAAVEALLTLGGRR